MISRVHTDTEGSNDDKGEACSSSSFPVCVHLAAYLSEADKSGIMQGAVEEARAHDSCEKRSASLHGVLESCPNVEVVMVQKLQHDLSRKHQARSPICRNF